MKKDSIEKLISGEKNIKFIAVLSKKETRSFSSKDGSYLELSFSDRTGTISGKKWDDIDNFDKYKKGDILEVTGDTSEYKGSIQLIVKSAKKSEDFDPLNFIPSYEDDELKKHEKNIKNLFSRVKNIYIRKLFDKFRKSSDYKRFLLAPAAKGYHHNKLGGLLVHTSSVMNLTEKISELYNISASDKDVLLAGAFFHDVGKIDEYEYSSHIDISVKGKLLGHISIGLTIIHELIAQIDDFPAELGEILKHLIISHHGQYEWGSPKKPKTIGAVILHFADHLDSKIEGISMLTEEAKSKGDIWTRNYDGRCFLSIDLPEDNNNEEQELF